ncbi:MAG: DUF4214 domain-containing protein [Acidimicrobiales bacterium]
MRARAVRAVCGGLVALLAAALWPVQQAGAARLDPASPGVRDSIQRLYLGLLGRPADPGGLEHWVGEYAGGRPLESIATAFAASEEALAVHGALPEDPTELVAHLYRSVLGRDPDPFGLEAHAADVASGAVTLGGLLTRFTECDEFVARTGTTPPAATPLPGSGETAPEGSGAGRRIVYAVAAQQVWLVDDGEAVVRTYAVSGKANTPRPGVYSVYSKSALAYATHDGWTMEHMVRFARGARLAIGFHAIPRTRAGRPVQGEDELGAYRSSGCVRQSDADAAFLYEWAPIGTTVVVLA